MSKRSQWLGCLCLVSALWSGAFAAAVPCGSRVARAQGADLPIRSVDARLVDDVPHVGFDARGFADSTVKDKLKSGLPQTLVVRVVARPEGRGEPVAISAQSCRVLYDLWQGSYRVQLDVPGKSVDLAVARLDQVVDRCLRVQDLPVPARSDTRIRGMRLYYAVVVELNPLSQDTVRRIRRWLSRPTGGQLAGDAFFGSFVSIFVGRQIGTAEKSLMFRSRVWVVPR